MKTPQRDDFKKIQINPNKARNAGNTELISTALRVQQKLQATSFRRVDRISKSRVKIKMKKPKGTISKKFKSIQIKPATQAIPNQSQTA
jgi:hypothetical protein